MKKLRILLAFLGFMFFISCGLKPIVPEYTFIKTDIENIELNNLGNGNILIYNGANILHKVDNTARLNIWLDDKPLAQLKPREYLIINVETGKHQFKLLHIDMVNMRSEHEVEISSDSKVIKVKPTITSNKLEVTNEFPKNFDKFSYFENN